MQKFILLLLLFSRFSFASFDMNENMQSSYSHIIALEFDEAKLKIAEEQLANPENGFIYLHKNYIDFLTIIIGEDFVLFECIYFLDLFFYKEKVKFLIMI